MQNWSHISDQVIIVIQIETFYHKESERIKTVDGLVKGCSISIANAL